jgi:hypothetical protein
MKPLTVDDVNIRLSITPMDSYKERPGFPENERISGTVNLLDLYVSLLDHILNLEYQNACLKDELTSLTKEEG